jgi:F0F1-type ATP synthase assembly protein I
MRLGGPRKGQSQRYAMVIDLTLQSVASLLIGALLGWWLWERFDAPTWVVLLCLMVGLASAVLTMVRYQRRFDRLGEDGDEKPGPGAS